MTKTFQEWSLQGYKIIKGSKAIWVDDVPMFTKDQTVKTRPKLYVNYTTREYDDEDAYGGQATFEEYY